MTNDAQDRQRRAYRGARSVEGVADFLRHHEKDAQLNAGGDRIAAILDTEPIATCGSVQSDPTPALRVFYVRERSVIVWTWTPDAGSTVTVHPRRDIISISVDDAPGQNWPYNGSIAFTATYPWGSLTFDSSNEWKPGLVDELLVAFLKELEEQ